MTVPPTSFSSPRRGKKPPVRQEEPKRSVLLVHNRYKLPGGEDRVGPVHGSLSTSLRVSPSSIPQTIPIARSDEPP